MHIELRDLSFSTRDEYLAWKAAWKAEYFTLARRIRAAKRKYHQPHRQVTGWRKEPDATSLAGMARRLFGWRPYSGQREVAIWSEGIDGYRAMLELHGLKAEARDALELRAQSKLKAGAQWRAQRQERATP